MELSAATRGDIAVVVRQTSGAAQVTRTCDSSNVVALRLARRCNLGAALLGAAELLVLRRQRGGSSVASAHHVLCACLLFAGAIPPFRYTSTALNHYAVEV